MTTKLQPKLRGIFLADDMLENLTNPVADIFSTLLSAVCSFLYYPIGLLINLVGDFFSTVVSAVSNFFNYLVSMLTNPVFNVSSTVITAVSNFFHNLIGLLTNPIVNIFSAIVSAVSSFFQNLTNPICAVLSTVISVVTNFFHYLTAVFKQPFPLEILSNLFSKLIFIGTNCFQYLTVLFNQTLENLTNSIGDMFFKVVVSPVTNSLQYLILLFNQEFPPETRDEQIKHLIFNYLLPVVVLITFIVFPLVCFGAVKQLFGFIRCVVVGCFNAVRSFLLVIFPCLCSGTKMGVKMMVAPGQPLLKISRAAFEANPSAYFLSLRGLPNNFVY